MRHFFLLTLVACTDLEDDSCSAYVDYMCDCHANDGSFDCEALRNEYENATLEQEDECALEHDDQLGSDADEGIECMNDTGI